MERALRDLDCSTTIGSHNRTYRRFEMLTDCAKEGNIYKTFPTGNSKSLKEIPKAKGISVRDELLKFFKFFTELIDVE